MKSLKRAIAPLAVLALLFPLAAVADQNLVPIRMSDNGDFLVPELAKGLGYFREEGLAVTRVAVEDVAPNDYMLQKPLVEGKIDASFHWFHQTLFGIRHNYPVKAVIMLSDSPGLKIMVANRLKDQIRTAADFKGRNVAEGMGYATKSVLTNYVALRAGLPLYSYHPVFAAEQGRQEAVLKGLQTGQVDIAAFLEPMASVLLSTKSVTTLYDLSTREGTIAALGAPFPAQCIIMAPRYIETHPDTTQHLVNAFVKTMRWMNSHSADEIVAKLPATYFTGKSREADISFLRHTLSNYAKGDYSFPKDGVELVINTVVTSRFDDSEEGVWRKTVENSKFTATDLYTNEFVEKAMKEIK